MRRVLLGVFVAAFAVLNCEGLSHNLLWAWKNPPRCSPPQTPLFAFYNRQNTDMIFNDGDEIEIWCQAGVRSSSGLTYSVHCNQVFLPFATGEAEDFPGNLFRIRIPTKDLTPGFYDVRVALDCGFKKLDLFSDKKSVNPVGVSTFGWRIDEMTFADSMPKDFKAFWSEAIASYEKIPLDLRIESEKKVFKGKEIDDYNMSSACLPGNFDPKGTKYDEVVSYKISWAGPDGRRVYAWLARPNVEGKKFPAILVLPGAGTGGRPRPLDHARHGYVAIDVQVHGFDVEVEGQPKVPGYNGVPPLSFADPKKFCWYNIYLRAYKGVSALAAQPEVDASRIVCAGGSQGGRLSYVVSALNPRVAATIPCIAHGANIPQLIWTKRRNVQTYGNEKREDLVVQTRTHGFGETVTVEDTEVMKCEAYFDPMNFSPMIACPIFANAGLIDPVSPAYATWAAFKRAGSADKTMNFVAGHGHDWFSSFDRLAYAWLEKTLAKANRAPVKGAERKSTFASFDRSDFLLDDVPVTLVFPKKAADGKPWIWRARFFGHQPQTDVALLEKGFHLVYVDVANLYGSPAAVARWDLAYRWLTETLGLSAKPVLEGMSRGGLIVFNWAKKNPDKVAAIYVDAPVCDFKDWPRAKSPVDWTRCKAAYGFAGEEEAVAYADNPKDNLEALAQAGVPVLAVCGAEDTVVEMKKNILVLAENYRKAGGNIRLVTKPVNGHHPHSLYDPTLIVDFARAHAVGENTTIVPRDGIGNAVRAFEKGKATVAFLGGSIVEMNGFRPLVCEGLKRLYPSCDFTFVAAGISSTCSDTGAFRLKRDILDKGPIDLLFVEFATNDSGDGSFPNGERSLHAMEGLVRQVRLANPKTEIVLLYTANESATASYMRNARALTADRLQAKEEHFDNSRGAVILPTPVAEFEQVARHYGLASINLGLDVAERMRHGEFDWKAFGGVHPAPMGNRLYAESILNLIRGQRSKPADIDRALPRAISPFNYERARMIAPETAKVVKGWTLDVPAWDKIPGNKRSRYTGVPTLHAEAPGAELTLDFTGTMIGLWLTAGSDAGAVDFRIDGGEWKTVDLFHAYSSSLHYPYTATLTDTLAPGPHTLTLRVSEKHHARSKGHAVRIMAFTAN